MTARPGQLSRRAVLGGALAGAGAVSAVQSRGSAIAATPAAIPRSVPGGLARDLRSSLADSAGRAVAFQAGVGAAIAFGDRLFHLDLRSGRLELFRRGRRVQSGRAETIDSGDFKVGAKLTHRHTLSQGRQRVEVTVDFEQLDDAGRMHKLDVRAGVPGRAPSVTLTAGYDAELRFVTDPRLSGAAPAFDFRSFQAAVELLTGQLAGALVVLPVTGAGSTEAGRAAVRCRRECGVFSGLAALAASPKTGFAAAGAMWPWAGWRVIWNF
ncbi:MAG TPA: hypothetical protein VGW10_09550 [Solirubrobacteraceae bacterium]|nr:hypothetical protein [Solirubrobacteraceae bacterium]